MATVVVMTLFVACGSNSGATKESDHSDRYSQAVLDRARESEDFRHAEELVSLCMDKAGYFGDPYAEGVILADGTLLRLGEGGRVVTGAYLEYLLVVQSCEASSGYNQVAEEHGLLVGLDDPERVRTTNERTVKQMACLETRGWAIPTPVTLRGVLVYDKQFESDEERAAWVADWTQCNMELFGNPTGWN